MSEQIPKEDLDYILEPFKEEDNNKEEDNKQIISEKIIAIVRDAKGKIIDKREQKMKSLTQYYLALMTIPIMGTYKKGTNNQASPFMTNILGLPSQQAVNTLQSAGSSAIGFDFSIQLGSGTQSFTPTLNSLNAPISNGTGTGQLNYNTNSVSLINNSIYTLTTVSNSSGNTITVSEIGLMGAITTCGCCEGCTTRYDLLSYDTFTFPIQIPQGGSATFQIIITFSG